MKLKQSTFINLIFYSSFFPYTKLIPFIDSKVQPITFIFSTLYIIIFGLKNSRLLKIFTIYIYLLIVISILSIYHFKISSTFLSFISLLIPIISVIPLLSDFKKINLSYFKPLLLIYFFVGLLQYLNLFKYISPLFDWFLVINNSIQIGSRGVSFLSPEPSNSAFIIMQFFLINQLFFKGRSQKINLLFIMGMVFLNLSGTLFFLLLIYLFGTLIFTFYKTSFKNKTTILLLTFFTIVFFSINFQNLSNSKIRGFILIGNTIEILKKNNFNFKDYGFVFGRRFQQLYAGYSEAFKNPIKIGIGSVNENFKNILLTDYLTNEKRSIDKILTQNQIKPNSYIAYLSFEIGYLIPLIFMIAILLNLLKESHYSKEIFGTILVFYIIICFRSTISIITPFVLLSLIYKNNKIDSNFNYHNY